MRTLSKLLAVLTAALMLAGPAWASPIYNNNGPVLSGPNSVYFIWYGNWTGNTATTLLPNLITNLSGSTYMNILSSYDNGAYPNFSTQVRFGGSSFNPSTTALDGTPTNTGANTIYSVVNAALTGGAFSGYNPANSIFDVLTAPGISVSGFQTSFCGWHTSTAFGQLTTGTQYGFIGDPNSSACAAQTAVSPNGNPGADAMASVIAHELFETITDPTGASWFDSISPTSAGNTGGFENGDMCNFNFGSTYRTGNGALANVNLNGTNYLLQQQWQNQGGGINYSGGACVTSLAFANPAPEPPALALLAVGLVGIGLARLGLTRLGLTRRRAA